MNSRKQETTLDLQTPESTIARMVVSLKGDNIDTKMLQAFYFFLGPQKGTPKFGKSHIQLLHTATSPRGLRSQGN